MSGVRSSMTIVALFGVVSSVSAQVGVGPSVGLRLERQGRFEEAVRVYMVALDQTPARLSDLLGLERALTRMDRLDSLLRFLERAVEAAPDQEIIREVEFRTRSALFGADSARAVAARWADRFPSSRNPYRLLSRWLAGAGDYSSADQVLAEGERRTGASLAELRAQLSVEAGDWSGAAQAWREAVHDNTGFVAPAASGLASAPETQRGAILEFILRGGERADHLLAADLLVRWDRVEEAWVVLDQGLPTDRTRAVNVLRRFAERAGRLRTRAGSRASALALERMADYLDGQEAMQVRLEAARAYAAAGHPESARRVLDRARQSGSAEGQRLAAERTLVEVTIQSGRLDEAERRYWEWSDRFSPDDVSALRARLARGWLQAGDVDRAERVLEADSSVSSLSVRGWIAAYRGEMAASRDLLREAGPAASTREDATRRAWLLVFLERIQVDRAPEIGHALLTLARGDSMEAAYALATASLRLSPAHGRADVLALAADLASASDLPEDAERWYRQGVLADSSGPATPHAEYALAVLLHRQGRYAEAREQLEHMILAHSESALVPQARRLLDEVRGMVPRS